MSGYAVQKEGDRVIGCRAVDGQERKSEDFPNGLFTNEVFWSLKKGPPPLPTEPPATRDELCKAVALACDELMAVAALRIAPLQDALDLSDFPDADAENLTLWKAYRIALSRVPFQEGFPDSVNWPVQPSRL